MGKEQGNPKPWSNDPIFQATYFCNVKREHDKVTRWIRTSVTAGLFDDWDHYEWAMGICRLLNHPPSILLALPNLMTHDPVGMVQALRQLEQDGEKVWGNAYVVTTHGIKTDKLSYLLRLAQEALNAPPRAHAHQHLSTAHMAVKKWEGFSDFMAAQVIADLKNTPQHPLANAPDWWDWCAPGPGSLRGLKWYLNTTHIPQGNFVSTLAAIREDIRGRIPMRLCLQDLQNCFCEYDKYMRVKNGTGRSKRKYNGRDND